MMADLRQFSLGGATDPAAIQGLNPQFSSALSALFAAAPEDVRTGLRIISAFRPEARQAELYQQAVAKYGSEQAARKWVAPPGKSNHNHGLAVDLRFVNDAAREWAHANAKNHGLHFPMAHEPWHIEPVGARQQRAAPTFIPSRYPQQMPPAQSTPQNPPTGLAALMVPPPPTFAGSFAQQLGQLAPQSSSQDSDKRRRALLFSDSTSLYS